MMLNLVWKNSFRKKSRFLLTCLSVMVAFFLFTALSGVNHALKINVSGNNQYRLMTNHKISMTKSLPVNYQQKISTIDGVEQVSFASWFGGYFRDEKNQLAVTAVDHQTYFELFDEYELTATQLTRWKNNRTGLIVGKKVADKFGWEIGDKIPLSSSIWMDKAGSFNWEFTLSAIYHSSDTSVDDSRVFFQHAYFDESRAYAGYMVSWLSTGVTPSVNMDEISQKIDEMFRNSSASTRTTTEQVFIKEQAQQFVDMAFVIEVVVAAVFFTLLLIVCNTMLQSNRERLNESAMMKALGFSSNTLIFQIFLESLLLLSIGAFSGALLALALIGEIRQYFSDFLPGIAIEPSHFLTVLMISIISAALCCVFPALSIKRMSISKTLGAMA